MPAPAALLRTTPAQGASAPRMRRAPGVVRHAPPSEGASFRSAAATTALEWELAALRDLLAQREAERDAALSMLKAAMALLSDGATEREPSRAALESALE